MLREAHLQVAARQRHPTLHVELSIVQRLCTSRRHVSNLAAGSARKAEQCRRRAQSSALTEVRESRANRQPRAERVARRARMRLADCERQRCSSATRGTAPTRGAPRSDEVRRHSSARSTTCRFARQLRALRPCSSSTRCAASARRDVSGPLKLAHPGATPSFSILEGARIFAPTGTPRRTEADVAWQ